MIGRQIASLNEERMRREIERLRIENDRLRKALKPFADACPKVEKFIKDRANDGGSPLMPFKDFRLAHFVAARDAIEATSQ